MSEILHKAIEKLEESSKIAKKKQLIKHAERIDRIIKYAEKSFNILVENDKNKLRELYSKTVKIKETIKNIAGQDNKQVIDDLIDDILIYITFLTSDASKINRSTLHLIIGFIFTLPITLPYNPLFTFSLVLLIISALITRHIGKVYNKTYFYLALILPLYAILFDSYIAVLDIVSILSNIWVQTVFVELSLSLIALFFLLYSLILTIKAKRIRILT